MVFVFFLVGVEGDADGVAEIDGEGDGCYGLGVSLSSWWTEAAESWEVCWKVGGKWEFQPFLSFDVQDSRMMVWSPSRKAVALQIHQRSVSPQPEDFIPLCAAVDYAIRWSTSYSDKCKIITYCTFRKTG